MQNNRIVAESYQKLIRRDGRNRKTVGITGFFGFFELFPLDGADGLGSQIHEDTVDALDLMGDAVGDVVQQSVGNLFDGGGHGVGGVHGADDGGPTLVTHLIAHANALHIGNGDEVLPDPTTIGNLCR